MTSEVTVRLGGREDREKILELRRVAFPGEDQEKREPAFWDWEFAENPAGEAIIAVAEAADQTIVGHYALVPQTYVRGGEERRALLAVDAMTHPGFQGKGIFSRVVARAMEETSGYDFATAFQIRDAVLPGMLRNGWLRTFRTPILVRPSGVAFRRPKDCDVRSLTPADTGAIEEIAGRFHEERIRRTRRDYSWKFVTNPSWRYESIALERRGHLAAYLIWCKRTLKGIPTAAIVDCGGSGNDVRALIATLIRTAIGRGALLVAALASPGGPLDGILRRMMFVPAPYAFNFLTHPLSGSGAPLDSEQWSISWADTDHL